MIKRFIGNNDEEFRRLLTSTIRDLQVLLTSESHAREFGQYAVSKFNLKFDQLLQQLTASGESLNPIQNHAASSKQEVESKQDALESSSVPLWSSLLGGAGGTMILGGVMASEYCGAAGCLAVCGAWSSNVLLVMLFSNILLRQRAVWSRRIGWSFIFFGIGSLAGGAIGKHLGDKRRQRMQDKLRQLCEQCDKMLQDIGTLRDDISKLEAESRQSKTPVVNAKESIEDFLAGFIDWQRFQDVLNEDITKLQSLETTLTQSQAHMPASFGSDLRTVGNGVLTGAAAGAVSCAGSMGQKSFMDIGRSAGFGAAVGGVAAVASLARRASVIHPNP